MSDELRALVDTSLSNRIPVELRGMDSDGRLVLRFSVNGSRWQASFEGRTFLRAVETSHSGSTRPLIGIDKFRLLLDLLEAEGDRLEALRVREEVMAGGDAGTVR